MPINTDPSLPPKSICDLSSPKALKEKLQPLIGTPFSLTRKPRTDGNRFLHLIEDTLMANDPPEAATKGSYNIVPPKKKGVPKFLREYVDTYLITTGDNYNLQVWNRNPDTDMIQVEYPESGEKLVSGDVRFVLGKINVKKQLIESLFIASPHQIVERFGAFGVPTSKQQLIISETAKQLIWTSPNNLAFFADDPSIANRLQWDARSATDFRIFPTARDKIMPISQIRSAIQSLIGKRIISNSTRTRSLELERAVVKLLGYQVPDGMYSEYPDVPNQLLEVKIQDSSTVDLGKYSPQDNQTIHSNYTTESVRYLIAITQPVTDIIESIFLGPGSTLGNYFSFVPDKSVKYQRGIKMTNFQSGAGKVVLWV